MATELMYRFCVREKRSQVSAFHTRKSFITPLFYTEEAAHERYEVIERLEHTAILRDTLVLQMESQCPD
ncbi:hypothetical protein [Zoogloea sp.]|uniref:hypothetical protein n=1 Tax=Zoogloea sp. TaxID=49181 RepID=UPI0035B3808D